MPRTRPPFAERGGRIRGALDLVTGSYPAFVCGGPVSDLLPVFHLHESDPVVLESRLAYLAGNGYRTVTADAISALVRRGVHPGPRTVALCFDDCWATLWTVAAPLLRRYGLSAIAFAIPARIQDATDVRPTIDTANQAATAPAVDRSDVPFATWPELRQLQASGLVDIQSHTRSHDAVFSDPHVVGFVTPAFANTNLLNRPVVSDAGRARPLTPDDLGAPLYVQRSRLSEALRYFDDEAARARCVEYVATRGAADFFARPSWQQELQRLASDARGRTETPAARAAAIVAELREGRLLLEARLGTTVRHICLPWGIAGATTRTLLGDTGHDLAFADRMFGRRAVRAGDDPHSLMRLHERFIHCLPGRGRRLFFTAV